MFQLDEAHFLKADLSTQTFTFQILIIHLVQHVVALMTKLYCPLQTAQKFRLSFVKVKVINSHVLDDDDEETNINSFIWPLARANKLNKQTKAHNLCNVS